MTLYRNSTYLVDAYPVTSELFTHQAIMTREGVTASTEGNGSGAEGETGSVVMCRAPQPVNDAFVGSWVMLVIEPESEAGQVQCWGDDFLSVWVEEQ